MKHPLTIAHIHASDYGGGAETLARNIHQLHLDLGHNSFLFVGNKIGEGENVFEIPRIKGIPGGQRLARFLERELGLQYLYAPGFRNLEHILPAHIDVLHIHSLHGSNGFADIGALPSLTNKIPTLLWLNDMWMLTGHCGHSLDCDRWKIGCGKCPDLLRFPSINRDGSRMNWMRKKRILNKCTVTVAGPSRWIIDRVEESPLLSNFPTAVVPNGVDTELFRKGSRSAARAELDLPHDIPIIMLAAQYIDHYCKGTYDAIQAINDAKDIDFQVLLVGRDSEKVAALLRVPSTALPYINCASKMVTCYNASNLVLMPSLGEIFGLVAAESMACGTPVMAYATGGLPEVLGGRDTGILIPTGDVNKLSLTLRKVLGDYGMLAAMGEAASKRIRQYFELNFQAKSFIELYRSIIDTHRLGRTP